jgi:hypothetical protein
MAKNKPGTMPAAPLPVMLVQGDNRDCTQRRSLPRPSPLLLTIFIVENEANKPHGVRLMGRLLFLHLHAVTMRVLWLSFVLLVRRDYDQ